MSGHSQRSQALTGSVAKVDDLAVGSDLAFQRKWWRFERIIWVLFTGVVLLDVLGGFGQGLLAKAHAFTADRSMTIDYDRITRYSTPSLVTIHFGRAAVRNGAVHMWASDSLLHALGVERLQPEPSSATLDGNGLLYTFPSTAHPNSIQFALQPRALGVQELTVRVPNTAELTIRTFVMP